MTNSEAHKDIVDITEALASWFTSQEISPAKAVSAMGYLIGVMASVDEKDLSKIDYRLKTVKDVMNAVAFIEYLTQRK